MNYRYKVFVPTLVFLLAGCSAGPTISTSSYEADIRDRCLSRLPDELKEDREKITGCTTTALFNVRLASRIYETMADDHKAACEQEFAKPAEAEACFIKKQKEFFNTWFYGHASSKKAE
ncbi:hypothetical protein [Marinobacter sp. C2H3]|uniref:hypothetical protein n=1 Tax=Marinobacter sp. C2H3 TaxID=3119003 RepID=UPI00300F2BFE